MVLSLTTLRLKRAVFRNPTSLTSGQFKSWHLGHGKYTLHYTCYVCVNQTVSGWGDAAAKLVDQERERREGAGVASKSPALSHLTSLNLSWVV